MAPYALPTACLPPHMQCPLAGAEAIPAGAPAEAFPLAPPEAWARVADLRRAVQGLHDATAPALQAVLAETTPETSRQALLAHREHEPKLLLEQYALYDAHFGVLRAADMPPEALAAQFGKTASELLADLPNTLLARDTLQSLVRAVETALDLFAAHGLQAEPAATEAWEPAEAMKMVRFRWRTAHQFFGLSSALCRHCLTWANQSLDAPEAFALDMDRATVFLTATTAAMEYATNFPASYYLETLRPEMDAAGMPGGFSGSQNSDYNHMKLAKGRLTAHLATHLGNDPGAWPPALRVPLKRFQRQELLDIDTHVRVAVNMIDGSRSLHQIALEENKEDAISALRRIADVRRHDFCA